MDSKNDIISIDRTTVWLKSLIQLCIFLLSQAMVSYTVLFNS